MAGTWRQQLETGLVASGSQGAGLAAPLIAYVELLAKWNKAYNLTAVREPGEMVTRHILDSLVVGPFVTGPLIDVGTGPGLPGIPLALAHPSMAVTLLDSNIKKTRFCRQAALELGLKNVEVVHARVEDYRPAEGFATVVSRAYASLAEFTATTRHLLAGGGKFLAMKGEYPHEEIHALPPDVRVLAVHPLNVPGLEAKRHLVEMDISA